MYILRIFIFFFLIIVINKTTNISCLDDYRCDRFILTIARVYLIKFPPPNQSNFELDNRSRSDINISLSLPHSFPLSFIIGENMRVARASLCFISPSISRYVTRSHLSFAISLQFSLLSRSLGSEFIYSPRRAMYDSCTAVYDMRRLYSRAFTFLRWCGISAHSASRETRGFYRRIYHSTGISRILQSCKFPGATLKTRHFEITEGRNFKKETRKKSVFTYKEKLCNNKKYSQKKER